MNLMCAEGIQKVGRSLSSDLLAEENWWMAVQTCVRLGLPPRVPEF